jgi:hypothetical protein
MSMFTGFFIVAGNKMVTNNLKRFIYTPFLAAPTTSGFNVKNS